MPAVADENHQETDKALAVLCDRLYARPHADRNYAALNGGEKKDAQRNKLALLVWLRSEFAQLTVDEIKAAEAQLVTRHTFAPDPQHIRSACFDVAVQRRFGDLPTLFASLVANITLWTSDRGMELPKEHAYLIHKIGARALREADFQRVEERLREELIGYVQAGAPDVLKSGVFAKSANNDVNLISRMERKAHDFSSLKALLASSGYAARNKDGN